MPAHADTVSLTPSLHARSELVDCPGDLVSRNARVRNAGKQRFFRHHITVANPARLNANPDLSWPRLRDLTLDDFEISPGFGYLYGFHLSHLVASLHCNEVAIPDHTRGTLICQPFVASWTF
jgi:hypothetical protein